jgi:hypothetical protein
MGYHFTKIAVAFFITKAVACVERWLEEVNVETVYQ